MSHQMQIEFTSTVWKYDGSAGWYFVSMLPESAKEIREIVKSEEQGWGRLSCVATIGKTTWKTAIWFDSKQGTYLLPIKSDIRKSENITTGDEVHVSVSI